MDFQGLSSVPDRSGVLGISPNKGRYEIITSNHMRRADLHAGDRVRLFMQYRWVPGVIRHSKEYVDLEKGVYVVEDASRPAWQAGYFFVADDGSFICGLCTGMRVDPDGEAARGIKVALSVLEYA